MSLRILFLGGSSYLGREIIKSFDGSSFDLSALVRSEEAKIKVTSANPKAKIYFSQQDIKDEYDIVFNLIVDYGRKSNDYDALYATNVTYPLEILKNIKTKSILNFSTALSGEVSNYSATKIALEQELVELGIKKSISVLNLKLQHFYGPNAPTENFISFLVESMLKNVGQLDLTDGEQKRDFLFIDDLLQAVELLICSESSLKGIDSIQVGSGITYKVRDVVLKVKELSGSQTMLNFGARERRPNEPEILKADITFLQTLGWRPKITLEEGLKKTIAGFVDKNQ